MSKLEAAVEDLKKLPLERLEQAADYIQRLKTVSERERRAILARTGKTLSAEEGEELQRIIEEGCESIDGREW